jgi:plasmid stability protein
MSSVTINHLDAELERQLREQAKLHGHSMEDEALAILREAFKPVIGTKANLAAAIRARFAPLGGVELPQVGGGSVPDPVNFGR